MDSKRGSQLDDVFWRTAIADISRVREHFSATKLTDRTRT